MNDAEMSQASSEHWGAFRDLGQDLDQDLDDRYYPRRTCPGGFDYAGHVCGEYCAAKEADDDAVRAVQPDPGNAPESA